MGAYRAMNYHSLTLVVILFLINSYIETSYAQDESGRIQGVTASDTTYIVDSSASVLRVYVAKAGILAAMGHNHVITFHEITGEIITKDVAQQSSASLKIDLTESIVDDEQERKRAGTAYDSIPGESARAGTLGNMNGPRVLDIVRFPLVNVTIARSMENRQADLYDVTLEFKDSTISLILPAVISIADNIIVVDSEFRLTHRQLGLRPFTAAGGLLKVADEIRFQLHVEAVSG